MFLVHTNTSITYMCLPKNHKAVGTNSRNRNSNAMSLGTNKSNIRTNVISITETYKLTKYQTHERANRDTIIFDIWFTLLWWIQEQKIFEPSKHFWFVSSLCSRQRSKINTTMCPKTSAALSAVKIYIRTAKRNQLLWEKHCSCIPPILQIGQSTWPTAKIWLS